MTVAIARDTRNNGAAGAAEGSQTTLRREAGTEATVSAALNSLDLGASRTGIQKKIGDQGRADALLRNSGVVGGDGFLASFLKIIGGRETPREGQVVKGPQLGGELDLNHKRNKDIKVSAGTDGNPPTVSFPSDFMRKIGAGGKVHLLVDTSKGLKVLETATRGEDGSFVFSKHGGEYPKNCTILIEPELSIRKTLVGKIPFRGGYGNMHIPLNQSA